MIFDFSSKVKKTEKLLHTFMPNNIGQAMYLSTEYSGLIYNHGGIS